MFSAYVLRSLRDHKRYIGLSGRGEQRQREHNAGRTKSTRWRRPFILTYQEEFETFEEARKREKYFKTAAGRRFLDKVETPFWKEYLKNNLRP
ncbi:MAG TPA: GIY-YIG nuclease family protein [Bacteroidota bacterium]|nr:GIY-YIG nuclease family protein [Bacteroidota bacterium]